MISTIEVPQNNTIKEQAPTEALPSVQTEEDNDATQNPEGMNRTFLSSYRAFDLFCFFKYQYYSGFVCRSFYL